MAREYFCAYHSLLETTKRLKDAEFGRLMRAAISYSASGESPAISGRELLMWDMVRWQIDQDRDSYIAKCSINAQNGKLGGRPKNQTVLQKTELFSEEPKKTKEKKNSKTPSVSKQSQSTRPFIPPTLEDVEKYCRERNNGVDAKRFYDYYADADWTDQNGKKVQNWKQKIIAVWERTAERSENDAPVERDYTAAPDGMRLLL